MSNPERPPVGAICWTDLTVPDAERVSAFYSAVVGWKPEPLDVGGYNDFNMIAPEAGGKCVAGVCHARGPNADMPAQWLLYLVVADVDRSAARCVELGGTLVVPPREMGGGRFCVIRDPAGAVCALCSPPA